MIPPPKSYVAFLVTSRLVIPSGEPRSDQLYKHFISKSDCTIRDVYGQAVFNMYRITENNRVLFSVKSPYLLLLLFTVIG